jgi:hypothetical protein
MHRLKVKVWKKIFQANSTKKRVEMAILISYITSFKPNCYKKQRKKHYILVKGSMQYNNYKYNHKTKLFQNL